MANGLVFSLLLLMGVAEASPVLAGSVKYANSVSSASEVASSVSSSVLNPNISSVEDDLKSMGVDIPSYRSSHNSKAVNYVSLVEWGYTPTVKASKAYCFFLYVYLPDDVSYKNDVTLTMSSLKAGEVATSISSYWSFVGSVVSVSSDGCFLKIKLGNAVSSFLYSNTDVDLRRYLIGQLILTPSNSSKSFSYPIGKEIDFSGCPVYEQGGIKESTLQGAVSELVTLRAETMPFVSDCGSIEQSVGYDFLNLKQRNMRVGLEAFNVLFSLPSSVDSYGVLDSVHYDYYKYRTDWIILTSDSDEYAQYNSMRGMDLLKSNGNYSSNGLSDCGFVFISPFDLDDIDVPLDSNIDGYAPSTRFFNNNVNTQAHSLRIDNPEWVFYSDKVNNNVIGGDKLLAYLDSYSYDVDSSNDLPRKNGKVSDKLLYVPSYSSDVKFGKYGYVDETVSRTELSSSLFSSLKEVLDVAPTAVGAYDSTYKTTYEYLKHYLEIQSPDTYSSVFGSSQPTLLSDYSSEDFFVKNAFDGYADDIQGFADTHSLDNVYRLSYSPCRYYSANLYSGKNNIYTEYWNGDSAVISKTDVCLDFNFIDFTFKDSDNKYYTLPSSSDPFSLAGDVATPDEDNGVVGLEDWQIAVLVCIAVVILGVVCMLFKPVWAVVKSIGSGVLSVMKFVVVAVYFVLVLWWYAIICKMSGKAVPKLWFWKK